MCYIVNWVSPHYTALTHALHLPTLHPSLKHYTSLHYTPHTRTAPPHTTPLTQALHLPTLHLPTLHPSLMHYTSPHYTPHSSTTPLTQALHLPTLHPSLKHCISGPWPFLQPLASSSGGFSHVTIPWYFSCCMFTHEFSYQKGGGGREGSCT